MFSSQSQLSTNISIAASKALVIELLTFLQIKFDIYCPLADGLMQWSGLTSE